MKTKKTKWITSFRYVVPTDYERWFEGLAEKGWHPQRVGQWSSIAMTFTKGTPKKYRFVVDMQVLPKADYKPTYESFGWEFVGQMASAFVWRKPYTNERPESFSDRENLKARNKRFITAISFSFALFLLASLAIIIAFALNFSKLTTGELLQFILGLLLSCGLTAYLGYVMRKISKARY